jgi:hypothetical protein
LKRRSRWSLDHDPTAPPLAANEADERWGEFASEPSVCVQSHRFLGGVCVQSSSAAVPAHSPASASSSSKTFPIGDDSIAN